MDLDSPAGTVLIGAVVLALIGLLVFWIGGTRASVLLGVREDSPWWFSPAGARTQGLVVAYLGAVVGVGSLVFLVVKAFLPDASALAWTLCWVSAVGFFAVTVTWFGRVVVPVATGGRGVWAEPAEGDYVDPDETLGDVDLRAARDAALAGDWRPAAHLLSATADPEARFDRLDALAHAGLRRSAWLDAWLRERPSDPHALALRAQLAVVRAWEIRGADWTPQHPERFLDALADAETYAREAVEVNPTDPSPHVTLIIAARGQQVDHDVLDRRFAALVALAPEHRQGHEQAMQYRCEKWFGSREEMFAFARDASARARPGSALALLVVQAHVEQWLVLSGPRGAKHMASPETRAEIAAAEQRWLGGGPSPVGRAYGHNLLAFAWWLADDAAAAQPHLQETARHLAETPWGYAGEPSEAHAQVQAWARATARPAVPASAV